MSLLQRILSLFKPSCSINQDKGGREAQNNYDNTMKYLIVGLGNVGEEYVGTRHNCGFMAADALVRKVDADAKFSLERHAYRAEVRYKGRILVVIKPTTFMNLSGKAVRYWMSAEKVELKNVLVFVDDIALPLGTLRMKRQGSHGGHNGLADIEAVIGTADYCRLRIGVGNDFPRGRQIEYVLGQFTADELAVLEPRIDAAADAALAFCTVGPDRAMNVCNSREQRGPEKD